MRSPAPGFSLLEVLIALLVLTVGLLSLAGTLEPMAALAREGKTHGRVAFILANRLDALRAQLRAGAPACGLPAGGSLLHPGGITERWRASREGTLTSVLLQGEFSDRHGLHVDSVASALPCP
jgi:prepilin-type N-terminal cleavage/methylation domain-containing protein